jgi:nucleotide-binding universal stress UspA family protein
MLTAMAPKIIVSYDDTANDRDALALGRLLAGAGGELSLAYVRHFPPSDRADELREQRAADALLARGAIAIGAPEMDRHVVLHASTGEGLWELAEREGADIVVFGSEYRTAAGTVRPGTSASRLLSGSPAAVAIAPAGFRSQLDCDLQRIGVVTEGDDLAPSETALSLATVTGASVVDGGQGALDLLVIGSSEEAPMGRLDLSALTSYAIDTARCPVLAVPRAKPISFSASSLSRA